MKVQPLGMLAVIVLALAAMTTTALWLRWLLGAGALLSAAAMFVLMQCRHRHATLLPAVHGAGPERDHARWYCDRCGQTWAASFIPETKPRLIYSGYDEHKAQRSAARADTLEKDRRRLAIKRAGWGHTAAAHAGSSARSGSGPRQLEVVPLRRRSGE
jgi:hypothetical protein